MPDLIVRIPDVSSERLRGLAGLIELLLNAHDLEAEVVAIDPEARDAH